MKERRRIAVINVIQLAAEFGPPEGRVADEAIAEQRVGDSGAELRDW